MKRFAWIFILSVTATADIANRNVVPFGEKEAFIGNCGTGGAQSTAAVYYNPAALTQLPHSRIAVSGSTYLQYSLSTDAITQVGDTKLPFNVSTFQTIPSTLVSTRKNETFTWAYFILVPEALKLDYHSGWTTPTARMDIIQNISTTDLWAGVSFAKEISPGWSLGVSLFLIQHSGSATSSTTTVSSAQANTASSVDAYQTGTTYGTSLTLGSLYRIAEWANIGVRLQSPILHLAGSGKAIAHGVVTDNGTVTEEKVQDDNLKMRHQLPFDMTVGFHFFPFENWNFYADVSYQAPLSYDQIVDSANFTDGSREEVKSTFRYGLGISHRLAEGLDIQTGFYVVPSAYSSGLGGKYHAVTAGLQSEGDKIRMGLGLFFSWADIAVQTSGTAPPGTLKNKLYGALISIGYIL